VKGRPDQIDLWCYDWAKERRKVFGLNVREFEPHERVGKLSCTLGQVREERDGASQGSMAVGLNGEPTQNWPEVYVGISLEIHRCFCTMRWEWRQVMDAQYVFKGIPVKEKLAVLNIKNMEYWGRLSMLKVYLSGYLQIETPIAQTKKSAPSLGKPLLFASG
jgi:hypothetical protein